MRIAIVHYHLGPGGVSQVIAASSRLLTDAGVRHVVLTGDAPADGIEDLPFRVVPGLGYGGTFAMEDLRKAAREFLGAAADLWHFHNHSLGRNASLADAVARLAVENERLVLQIHDLAEEGRPANFRNLRDPSTLYPFSERVNYAFLNERDRQVFLNAGLGEGNAALLGNPVSIPQKVTTAEDGAPLIFAPVRGIRRKNLGELVLLSTITPEGVRIAVSRAPASGEALAIHDAWRRFAARRNLPIEFAVADRIPPVAGEAASFESWVRHASHYVSTSVAEGFGLPFLEAAALGKPLIGRRLAHIAAEHARHGILAGDLYDRLLVPADWIDAGYLEEYLKTTLERNHRLLGIRPPRGTIKDTLAHLTRGGRIDFGNLPEPLQQGIIERIIDPTNRDELLVETGGAISPARPWLAGAVANRRPSTTREQLAPYAASSYQTRLLDLYQNVMTRPASATRFLPAGGVLQAFLSPEAFHFLLSAAPSQADCRIPYRAVICDIYGTLLVAAAGGVKPDPGADPLLRRTIEHFGHRPPESPSTAIHEAVRRHHEASGRRFPEVDLRKLWREVLSLPEGTEVTALVNAIEDAWHPAAPMPDAWEAIQQFAREGVALGILSNAQCNTLPTLGGIRELFAPELTILSYQHGMAKPSPELFEILIDRLAGRGIAPDETLFVGNDPVRDIAPAAAHGFKTALFTGHPESLGNGECQPDIEFGDWSALRRLTRQNMRLQ